MIEHHEKVCTIRTLNARRDIRDNLPQMIEIPLHLKKRRHGVLLQGKRLAAGDEIYALESELRRRDNGRLYRQFDHRQLVLFKEMQDFCIALRKPTGPFAVAVIPRDEIPRHGNRPLVEPADMEEFIFRAPFHVIDRDIRQMKAPELLRVIVPIRADIPDNGMRRLNPWTIGQLRADIVGCILCPELIHDL